MGGNARQEPGNTLSGGLPVKITGIVFWGMVLVGLLIAFVMLESKEHELAALNASNATVLAGEIIEHIGENRSPVLTLNTLHDDLQEVVKTLQPNLGFEAVELSSQGNTLLFGSKNPEQETITRTLRIDATPGTPSSTLRMTVFFPNIKKTTADYRKQILISVGLMVVAFGLVLQRILHHLLSQPFFSMVTSAQNFGSGDTTARFDETRGDEFGFLARFINQALDSIVQQQKELREALSRAIQSETALSSEKERAEVTLQSIADAVITTNDAGEVQYLNPVAERLTGWENADARGLPLESVIHIVRENSQETMPNPVRECLASNAESVLAPHAALLRRDGQSISIEATATPMRNEQGQIIGAVMVGQDVSQARKLALQLSYQASHDALTGLYNRLRFEEHLKQLLAGAEKNDQHALLYLDLDQFKIVNDTCGHMAGDELLRQLATELQDCIRRGDILARLGGDEFGVLLENCDLERATEIANKMRHQVREFRFAWHDKTFEVGASIGVVGITADNLNAANILSAADLACYAAKDMGRNRVHVYQPTDNELQQRHGEMHWTTLITQALEHDHFILFRQKIIATSATGEDCQHWEVLLRMKDEQGRIITPDSFIPAAERYNKMHSIDRWVIHNVFAAMAKGCFAMPEASRGIIAINLSGASLGDESMLDYIRTASEKSGIALNRICFEITETVAISNLTKATQFIHELKALGCRFSLDDFGSGLSSFGYLKNLPVDYIKIDGSFVKDMASDPIDRAMVEAINQIGQVMRIQTIAEWVENEETLMLLQQIGVNFVQGYHIGKPFPLCDLP